jgi:hypothetical protein
MSRRKGLSCMMYLAEMRYQITDSTDRIWMNLVCARHLAPASTLRLLVGMNS